MKLHRITDFSTIYVYLKIIYVMYAYVCNKNPIKMKHYSKYLFLNDSIIIYKTNNIMIYITIIILYDLSTMCPFKYDFHYSFDINQTYKLIPHSATLLKINN
jgi:hypothetical protein